MFYLDEGFYNKLLNIYMKQENNINRETSVNIGDKTADDLKKEVSKSQSEEDGSSLSEPDDSNNEEEEQHSEMISNSDNLNDSLAPNITRLPSISFKKPQTT